MASVRSRVWKMLKSHGPSALPRLVLYGASEAWYEWRFGIRTLGYLTREELGIEDKAAGYYAPTAYLDFRKAMRRVGVRPGEDVFLDLGSGMGRAVIMAATYPFRKVIGVELSAELSRTAEENLRRARRRLACRDVELVTADATAYEVPPEVTVVYLYNPFRGETLRKVFERLGRSLAESPRTLHLVFKNPVYFEQDLGGVPWLTKTDEFRCLTGHRCAIYRSAAADSPERED